MTSPENKIRDQQTLYEDLLREQLINRMVVMWGVLAVIGFFLLQARAFKIGWTARDYTYIIILATAIGIAFVRRKLAIQHKAILIIIFNLVVGGLGVSHYGMLGGGIFFFLLSAVIISLFYSTRLVVIFGVLTTVFLCFIAMAFISNYLTIVPSAGFLLANYEHWSVYILAFAVFFLITCVTILDYRKIMKKLIENVNVQRDELEKKNKDLQRALDEIKTLRGILPLCSFCKKIRNDEGYWEQVDVYIGKYSEADISHGICPECMKKYYPEMYQEYEKNKDEE